MDIPCDPAQPNLRGAATFGVNASIDTTGVQILAANPDRRIGVWVRGTHASVMALVGDAAGTATAPCGLGTNAAGQFFIPGTGPVYVKAASATTSVSWISY